MAGGGVTSVVRGATLRCANCGSGGVFDGFFTLKSSCPSCGLRFEREEGYWLGALIVAFALTGGTFMLWFVFGMLLTWPDVPWTLFLVGGIAITAILPVVSYGWTKTMWMGIHAAFVDPEPDRDFVGPTEEHPDPEDHPDTAASS